MPSRIAFVGLGNMGTPMVRRLIASGQFDITVFDTDSARTDAVCIDGRAQPAATPAHAADGSDVVVLMLPNGRVVDAVLRGEGSRGGILSAATSPIVIDMSSSDPATYDVLADLLQAADAAIVDAPVSGGVKGAEAGTLSIMVGGEASAIARARPVLELLGERIFETGGLGTGQAMKALNNLLSAGTLILTLETLAIGRRNGLDLDQMTEILNVSTGRNNSTDRKVRQFILSSAYNSGFGHSLMAKDVATALSLPGASATDVPLSVHAGDLVAKSEQALGEKADHTEIARIVMNGLP